MRIGRDLRPHCPYEDRLFVKGIVLVQLAAAVMKLAHELPGQNCGLTVDERLTPLVRLRIVQKQRQSFPMSLRTVGLNLFQPRAPTPNQSCRDRAVEFDHVARSRERIERTAYVCMPHASAEIKIVGAISGLSRLRSG